MRRGRRAAHKRPPWPERVFHEDIEPLLHDPAPMRRAWATALLAVVAALTLTAVVLVVLRATGVTGENPAPSSQPRQVSSSPPALATTSPAVDDRQVRETCHELWTLQQQVLAAAHPAMDQWGEHIAAMNQLVAGKITLAQAQAYWGKTRRGAAGNVHAFDAAEKRLESLGASECTAPASPSATSPALAACLDAVDAARTTLGSAVTTTVTWRHHIRDMERLRAGTLSPTMAQQMWLQTWKKGARELRTYRQDEIRSDALACTP